MSQIYNAKNAKRMNGHQLRDLAEVEFIKSLFYFIISPQSKGKSQR